MELIEQLRRNTDKAIQDRKLMLFEKHKAMIEEECIKQSKLGKSNKIFDCKHEAFSDLCECKEVIMISTGLKVFKDGYESYIQLSW